MKLPQVVEEIPWGYNREVISKCKSVEEYLFYVHKTIEEGWSRSTMLHFIEADYSNSHGKAVTNFSDTLPAVQNDEGVSEYFAPLAGAKNYPYNDLRSTTNLISLGAHVNIDLVSIWQDDSRWSALIIPAIYGVVSSADVKQISDKEKVRSESAFHFGVGADLGVGYMITPCWGLRLKTGISLLTGKPMDAMPKTEHKSNYVWATSLQVIFKM